jgi:hypothetical protein
VSTFHEGAQFKTADPVLDMSRGELDASMQVSSVDDSFNVNKAVLTQSTSSHMP